MTIKIIHLTLWFLLLGSSGQLLQAQDGQTENPPVHREIFIGGGIHTRGFQITAGYSIIDRSRRTKSFFAEFGEIKHPKENRQSYEGLSGSGSGSSAFIYGKRNHLYMTRIGYGEKFYLSAKNTRLVSLGFTYAAGISIGMIRPYYLDLIYRDNGGRPNIIAERYNESNRIKFLNPQEVSGPSGAAYGWDELGIRPGLFAKAGLLIDWGAYDNVVKAMEVGVSADFYTEDIPMMIFEENTPIFVNLYFNVYLGHRW